MAESRLFQLLLILLDKGRVTAPELAERFEVSVRTIYRDIDNLSSAGIPVYMTQGKGGGIFLEDGYVLNKSLISEQEQTQILMALQGMSMVAEEEADLLLTKLGGIFRKQNVNWIEVDFSDWNRKGEDTFRTLKEAIFSNKVVQFKYFSGKGQYRERSVEPLKLAFKSRDWYLYAYCCEKQDYRLFKLKRIRELQIQEQVFIRPAPAQVFANLNLYTDKTVTLTLLFGPESASRVYENFEDIEEQGDGSYLVRVMLPENESMYSFLLSLGSQVEVLSPPEIRGTIQKRIDNLKKIYET